MVNYPAAIDTQIELPTVIDNKTPVSGEIINNLRDTVIAIESELGIKPRGIYANVRSRIVALEIAVANMSGGGNITNYVPYFDAPVVNGISSTTNGTFTAVANFEFDPTVIVQTNGGRSIKLRVIAQTTGPQMTIQLFNLTANAAVTGSILTTTSTTPVLLQTGDLTSVLTNGSAIYQLQVKMAAGGGGDKVTTSFANLRITWA